jgi:hypothetical protein
MTTTCIDPTAISEGDLIRYVDGEAEPAIGDHVRWCPACACWAGYHSAERSPAPGNPAPSRWPSEALGFAAIGPSPLAQSSCPPHLPQNLAPGLCADVPHWGQRRTELVSLSMHSFSFRSVFSQLALCAAPPSLKDAPPFGSDSRTSTIVLVLPSDVNLYVVSIHAPERQIS